MVISDVKRVLNELKVIYGAHQMRVIIEDLLHGVRGKSQALPLLDDGQIHGIIILSAQNHPQSLSDVGHGDGLISLLFRFTLVLHIILRGDDGGKGLTHVQVNIFSFNHCIIYDHHHIQARVHGLFLQRKVHDDDENHLIHDEGALHYDDY